MIRANGAAARILAFLNKYIYFIQKLIFKKLQRSIEVKFKVKFGNPKNEAYFKVINFFKFFKFFFFFFFLEPEHKLTRLNFTTFLTWLFV